MPSLHLHHSRARRSFNPWSGMYASELIWRVPQDCLFEVQPIALKPSPIFCRISIRCRCWCLDPSDRFPFFFSSTIVSQPHIPITMRWPVDSSMCAQHMTPLDFESIARGPRYPRSHMRVFSSLHLPNTDDIIGTHGLPSCLFGFLTRRTLNGGKRMAFLAMMDDATGCDSARRGRQFWVDRVCTWVRMCPLKRSRTNIRVSWGGSRVWQAGRQDVL